MTQIFTERNINFANEWVAPARKLGNIEARLAVASQQVFWLNKKNTRQKYSAFGFQKSTQTAPEQESRKNNFKRLMSF